MVTQNKYPETCPVVMQFRIGLLIDRINATTGLAKIQYINDYRFRAEMYNNIVGFEAYNLNYRGGE